LKKTGAPDLILSKPNKKTLVRSETTGVNSLISGEPESKDPYSRIFIYQQAFYSIFQHRRQQIVFGERPEDAECSYGP
jgi:hypothetical protein